MSEPTFSGGRTHTPAAERTAQNHQLVDQVTTELGREVTVREAQAHRRKYKGVADIIRRDIAFEDLEPLGVMLAKAEGMRTYSGGTCAVSLTTNAREFGDVAMEASLASNSDLLVAVIYTIPRNLGLDDDEDDEGDDGGGYGEAED